MHYYVTQGYSARGLFVDYGQLSAGLEREAVERICKSYKIPFDVISLSGMKKWKNGFVLGRNAFLLFTALMNFNEENGLVAIGVHDGTDYWDCKRDFMSKIKGLFDAYSNGQILIDAPFIDWSKREIWEYCIKENVPIKKTYSCELGQKQPCKKCLSCKDLETLYAL